MPQAPLFRQELRSLNFVTCYSHVEVFLRAASVFFRQELRSLNFVTCYSPVEVFLRAAGAFFQAKMTFLGFLNHVIALLRSCCVPQAIVFRQKNVPGTFRTCNSPAEVFLRAAGAFLSAKSDSQMALIIFVMGEDL